MAARRPILTALPIFCSLFSFVICLLILLAGTRNTLSNFYYVKTDTSGLSVPAKLSSSQFLKDLSDVSGKDLVGPTSTASSLGLADSYTLLLLTSCAHFAHGSVSCAAPRIGFAFDPASGLSLDSTALQGTYPSSFLSALSAYHHASRFLAAAYVLGAALTGLAVLLAAFSACSSGRRSSPRRRRGRRVAAAGGGGASLAVSAAVASAIAAALLLGAVIAAAVVFTRLVSQFNDAFDDKAGISASRGIAPLVAGGIAFLLALLASVGFGVLARSLKQQQAWAAAAAAAAAGSGAVLVTGKPGSAEEGVAADGEKAPPRPGLWGRIPTWSKHRYVQVEKQPAVARTVVTGRPQEAAIMEDDASYPDADARRRLDDDWNADDEYTAGGESIAMSSIGIGNKRKRDLNSAYEPYSGATVGVGNAEHTST
ncbi:hypothetical protein VTK73DRAFT_8575 [Phialemonium thermophilum]|uniref:SUR7/PalI family protein n=1 Tax=Phialemonium thermophilum TaxID=223376 RepID=A0ABR3W7N2_9PEZI